MRFFHTLRFQVTVLLMIAMMGISVISVAAHITYQTIKEMAQSELQPSVVYRHKNVDGSLEKDTAITNAIAHELFETQKGNTPLWVILVVGGYVTLITVCASFVAVVVGNMIARPLSILGRAIDSVDPRDVIPLLKEDGIYEDRETTKLINKLSEKVKLAMESRMRLVAAAGHDLRTPLTRMRLRCEFIEDEKQRSIWLRDVDELTNIANDAITLVKEEVNPEGKATLRLDELIKESVQDLEMIGHDIKLVRSVPCEVVGKALSLKRALTNLMVNGATHGQGAKVAILTENGKAIVLIVDEGPGIPANMIDRAFEPFFRANISRHKHSAGAGLGLAIVKEIITAHDGTVTLSNRATKGLVQKVILPLAP